ncbi:MAG: 16S rRNA (cytidine(1402)-2'-O)-methyltransferase [Candidatus Gracilibacteria bacterium]
MASLYIVATPIGNLQDITLRALETLKTVDFIICEDTRHSSKLLFHFEISKPLISFHAHSSERDLAKIMGMLGEGKSAAIISDAGTPGISDPGYMLIQACRKENISVIPIPGASAFLTALMASGLPTNRFWYYGFLPAKKGREALFKKFATLTNETIVTYESPYRILRTLEKMTLIMPDRQIVLARELTKIHEEFLKGTVSELYAIFRQRSKIQGEFVMIIAPENWDESESGDEKPAVKIPRVKKQKYLPKTSKAHSELNEE